MEDTISATEAGTIQIGDMIVNRLGLGTNRITDSEEARELLQRAIELDVNFIDTAHRYQNGASETGIASALAPYGNGLIIATKGGLDNDGPDGAPTSLRADLEDSLQRLQVDCIDLYQLHRIDPRVPLEESITALKQFQVEGKIRHIGLSEVTVEQLHEAQKIAPIVSVQNEYNIMKRNHETLVDYCTDQNIAFIPWFPLGGLAGGAEEVERLLADMAKQYAVSPQQLALAWLLKRSPVMLPIPGTLSISHLEDNLRAATIELSEEDYNQLSLSATA